MAKQIQGIQTSTTSPGAYGGGSEVAAAKPVSSPTGAGSVPLTEREIYSAALEGLKSNRPFEWKTSPSSPAAGSTIPATDVNRSSARAMPGEGTTAASGAPVTAAANPSSTTDKNNVGGGYSGGSYGGGGGYTASPTPASTEQADTPAAEKTPEEQLREAWASASETTKRIVDGAKPEELTIGQIERVDVSGIEKILEQIKAVQEQQSSGQIDYAAQQGINEVNRAVEDAAAAYQTQRNQIAADEQRALDNQALYAEARGDRGGIGQSQYGSIQNTAATNRYRINQEQTKLSTDAARQIADLRAQGEYKKADALLSISQNYLSNLKELEQYALQTNLGVDEFNKQLEQWKADYDLSVKQYLINTEMSAANMTGAFSDGTPTLTEKARMQEQLASAAKAMLDMGFELTDDQISALGWTRDQYAQYKNKRAAETAEASYSSGLRSYDNGSYSREQVAEMQSDINAELVRRGYAPIAVDGLIGAETLAAMEAVDYGNTSTPVYTTDYTGGGNLGNGGR